MKKTTQGFQPRKLDLKKKTVMRLNAIKKGNLLGGNETDSKTSSIGGASCTNVCNTTVETMSDNPIIKISIFKC